MSYARLGPDSDVYVLDGGDVLVCQWCQLPNDHGQWRTRADMIVHLQRHVLAGHKVPSTAFARLHYEVALGDRNVLFLGDSWVDSSGNVRHG